MEARGGVEPLDDTAEVKVDVSVRGRPRSTKRVRTPSGPDRKQVIRALFNNDRYKELLDAGLRRPAPTRWPRGAAPGRHRGPGDRRAGGCPELRDRVAAHLQRRVAVPAFDFRGTVDVDIKVLSPRGKDTPYQTQIRYRIAPRRAGCREVPAPRASVRT
jgi:hypothetical protein